VARYSAERKESILKKMLPPHNVTVAEIARQEHISLKTLVNWRDTDRQQGVPVPENKLSADDWGGGWRQTLSDHPNGCVPPVSG